MAMSMLLQARKKKKKRINTKYGLCTNPACGGVMTSNTHTERCPTEKRRPETLMIQHTDNPKGHKRTFYTDGSGKKIPQSNTLETGWATVEVQEHTQPSQEIFITKLQTWKGKSPLLESVPRVEARAILKTTEIVSEESSFQCLTDSLTTIQNLKKLIYGTLKQAKQIANRDILTQIKNTLASKKLNMMLEWVKGHENMPEKNHNWISKMKSQGNSWADEEAGEAVTQPDPEEQFQTTQTYKLTNSITGNRVDPRALNKMTQRNFTSARQHRLTKKRDPTAQHGQGPRITNFIVHRMMTFKQATKGPVGTLNIIHHIGTDRIHTLERKARLLEQKHGRSIQATGKQCPICHIKGVNKIQTKEHLFTGECTATTQIRTRGEQSIIGHIHHLTIPKEIKEKIKQIVKKQWQDVDTEELIPTLKNQKQLAASIGLWDTKTNHTLIDILIQTKIYTEAQAEALVALWNKWNMEMTERIYTHCMNHKDLIFNKLTPKEQQLLTEMKLSNLEDTLEYSIGYSPEEKLTFYQKVNLAHQNQLTLKKPKCPNREQAQIQKQPRTIDLNRALNSKRHREEKTVTTTETSQKKQKTQTPQEEKGQTITKAEGRKQTTKQTETKQRPTQTNKRTRQPEMEQNTQKKQKSEQAQTPDLDNITGGGGQQTSAQKMTQQGSTAHIKPTKEWPKEKTIENKKQRKGKSYTGKKHRRQTPSTLCNTDKQPTKTQKQTQKNTMPTIEQLINRIAITTKKTSKKRHAGH